MKNLVKIAVVAFVFCILGTSCTKSNLAEDQNLYEQASEGNTENPKEKKEDPNE